MMAASPTPPVRVTVRAKPKAKRSRVVSAQGLAAEVQLAALPAEGAANAELLSLLAEVLEVRQSALELVMGATSRQKVVQVTGLSAAIVAERLAAAVR
jgi:uncharacterized protein (TIGR00251 family)